MQYAIVSDTLLISNTPKITMYEVANAVNKPVVLIMGFV